jgi:acetyl esterase/lipase
MSGWRPRVGAALAAAALAAGACGSDGDRVEIEQGVPYTDAASLDVHAPRRPRLAPVVVTLHGCCGDKHDLTALAHGLAEQGAVVFNASWRIGADAAGYPQAYERAACAVRFARARARLYGGDPGRVTLVGWSDGALLAAVIGNAGEEFQGPCRAGRGRNPEAVVSLGGFLGWPLAGGGIDPAYVNEQTIGFFGGPPEETAPAWRAGNPYAHLGRHPDVEFRLVVAAGDELAPDSHRFAEAARRAAHPVSVRVAEGGGHQTIIAPRTPEGALAVREILLAARGPSDRTPTPPLR